MSKLTDRITEMEGYLDTCAAASKQLEEALDAYEACRRQYAKLRAYYEGGQWLKDYEADEKGKVPQDLNRGVLSEDAVYDLLAENKELTVRMLKAVQANIEKQ